MQRGLLGAPTAAAGHSYPGLERSENCAPNGASGQIMERQQKPGTDRAPLGAYYGCAGGKAAFPAFPAASGLTVATAEPALNWAPALPADSCDVTVQGPAPKRLRTAHGLQPSWGGYGGGGAASGASGWGDSGASCATDDESDDEDVAVSRKHPTPVKAPEPSAEADAAACAAPPARPVKPAGSRFGGDAAAAGAAVVSAALHRRRVMWGDVRWEMPARSHADDQEAEEEEETGSQGSDCMEEDSSAGGWQRFPHAAHPLDVEE